MAAAAIALEGGTMTDYQTLELVKVLAEIKLELVRIRKTIEGKKDDGK